MANTIIQIKKSSTSVAPSNGSLSSAEPAYSYLSGKLFLGNTTGDGIVEVGGQYWTDLTSQAFAQANAAFEAANTGNNAAVFTQANAAFEQANTARVHANSAHETSNASYDQANTARDHANTGWAHANAAYDKANSANVLAFNTGIGANAYTVEVGTAGNNYTIEVGAASNNWANTVATAANTYANATFVKLNDGNQTITGDIAITGNLFISGNTTTVSSQDLVIEDPVFILANNNITDLTDIGFVAHYANATSDQVHTGLIRDPGTKQWYFFKEYNDHFFYSGGNINLSGNNFTLDTVNANFVTNNLILGGANAIITIGAAFDKANAANVLAYNTGIGANAYTDAVGVAANNWANTISDARATASNTYAETIGTAGNNYTIEVGAAANNWANTISATRTDAANGWANLVATYANTYADAVGLAANTNAANGSYISTGIVSVGVGGTGATSFTLNGVLYGNTAGPIKVTAAGTEGQVLTVTAAGAPAFSHIDGGNF